ncbi:MAG: hypothetical protein HOP17_07765 [Acidobacteria bacterium]|nr:hypothetical protein [Acidobacteriota bacterium]
MLEKLRSNALTLGTFALMGMASIVYLSAGVAATSGSSGPNFSTGQTPTPSPTPCTGDDPKKPCPSPTPSPSPTMAP